MRTAVIAGAAAIPLLVKAAAMLVPAAHGYVLHLTAANHATISFSEVYATKSSATRAVRNSARRIARQLLTPPPK